MMKYTFIFLLFVISIQLRAVTISVDTYGADGNDAIDDTTSIQNAINQLSDGDELEFTSGTYLISSSLTLATDNVTVTFLNNVKLKVTSELGNALLCTSDGVTFNDYSLDGNNLCYIGLQLYICEDIVLNRPTITNINGDWQSGEHLAEAIRVRTCTNVEIDDGYFENIKTGDSLAATGIHCISLSNTEKCYNISIDGCEFKTIEADIDSDGIKFIGPGVDVNSTIENCTFYNCYKRGIKLQDHNIQVSNVSITNDKTNTDFNSSYLVDFQHADDCSLTDSLISVAGKDSGGIGLWGDNILIENVDIYLNRKTTSTEAYKVWAIRKYGTTNDYLTNSTIRDVNIYGDFYQAIWLKDSSLDDDDIILDNIFSRKDIVVDSGVTNVTISNSTFHQYYGTVTQTNCLNSSMSPVAHYKMDESSGTIYDSSNNNNDSFATSALTYGLSGAIHNAISLNGSSSYIQIPNSSSLQNLNHHITITAWIYPDVSSDRCILNKKWDSQASGFELRTYYGRLRFRFGDGTNTQNIDSSINMYQTGQWQHVAAVYDGKNVKFYVNGELKDTCAATGRISGNANPIYIGKHQGASHYFDGKLDDIRIYNRSLTSYQIKETAYMTAFYKLEGDGTDETGYNSAAIYGSPTTVASKVNNGLDLDSSNQTKQYLRAANHSTLTLGQQITISTWIKPYTLPWGSIIVSKKWESVNDGYQLKTYYNKLKLFVNGTVLTTSNNLLNTDILQHVVVTFDGIDAKFYVNSILKETVSASSSVTATANQCYLYIGAYQDTNYYRFDGIIDELRLFNCVLEQNEVTEVFNEGWVQYQQQQ